MGQEKLLSFLAQVAKNKQQQSESKPEADVDEDSQDNQDNEKWGKQGSKDECGNKDEFAAFKFLSRLQTKMNVAQEELHPFKTKMNLVKEELHPFDTESLEVVLKSNSHRRASCLSLPFTLTFFILFAISSEQHERVRLVNRAEDAVDEGIGASTFDEAQTKWVKDCTGAADIWKFLKQTVVAPGVSPWFQQEDQFGNPVPPEHRDGAFNMFHLVGGFLLEQVRSPKVGCASANMPRAWDCVPTDAESLSSGFGPALQTEHNSSSIKRSAAAYYHGEGFMPLAVEGDSELSYSGGLLDHARRLSVDLDGGVLDHSRRLRGGDGGGLDSSEGLEASMYWSPPQTRYPFFLFEQLSMKELQERVDYLEENGWLDKQTNFLSMSGILFNSEFGLLTRVSIRFHFGRTGSVDVGVKIRTIHMIAYPHSVLYLVDALWVGLLIVIFVTEIQEACAAWKQSRDGSSEWVDYVCSFWNLLDWATILFGFWIVTAFIYQNLATMELSDLILALPKVSDSLTADDLRKYYKVHLSVDSISHFVMYYRLGLSFYVLVLMMRFFKAFSAQPRLALVTTTLYVAGADVIHFLVVFTMIFSTYAYSGVLLFGYRLSAFSNFHLAVASSFAIACGEFNWAELATEHPLTAATWFWSFMLIVFFVLLNMVIAIIMDVYSEVRSQADFCPPLWTQLRQVVESFRNGGWVKDMDHHSVEVKLIKFLEDVKTDTISSSDLKEAVPELNNKHLKEIADQVKIHDEISTQRMRVSDAMRAIGVIHVNVEHGMQAFRKAEGEVATRRQLDNFLSNLDERMDVKMSNKMLNKHASEIETLKNQYSLLAQCKTNGRAIEAGQIAEEPETSGAEPITAEEEGGTSIKEMKLELQVMMKQMNELLLVTKQLCGLVTSKNSDSMNQSSLPQKAGKKCNDNTGDSNQVLEEVRKLSVTLARECFERARSEASIQRELKDVRDILISFGSANPVKAQVEQPPGKPSEGLNETMQSGSEVVYVSGQENLGTGGLPFVPVSHQHDEAQRIDSPRDNAQLLPQYCIGAPYDIVPSTCPQLQEQIRSQHIQGGPQHAQIGSQHASFQQAQRGPQHAQTVFQHVQRSPQHAQTGSQQAVSDPQHGQTFPQHAQTDPQRAHPTTPQTTPQEQKAHAPDGSQRVGPQRPQSAHALDGSHLDGGSSYQYNHDQQRVPQRPQSSHHLQRQQYDVSHAQQHMRQLHNMWMQQQRPHVHPNALAGGGVGPNGQAIGSPRSHGEHTYQNQAMVGRRPGTWDVSEVPPPGWIPW